jgi:hypothetical protein
MVCRCVFWVLYNSATCVFRVVMSSLWLENKGNGVNGGDVDDGEAGIVPGEPSARRVEYNVASFVSGLAEMMNGLQASYTSDARCSLASRCSRDCKRVSFQLVVSVIDIVRPHTLIPTCKFE